MRNLIRTAAAAAAALCLLPVAASAQPAAQAPSAADQVRAMGRGINIIGYDPLWTDRSKARFQARHFAEIRRAGFSTVRVNLQAFRHMDSANRLDPKWMETLDWVVREATAQGLHVIIDEHDYNVCGEDPDGCRPKLLAFWRQVGEHYRAAPGTVLFELLNEPNKGLTDARWNALLAETLAVVRQSNPTRTVVIGPAFWNNIEHLEQMKLPEGDRNIVVTVHYYLPMEFTHQGASWNPETTKLHDVAWGTPAEQARLAHEFDGVQRWSKAHDRPIFLGEFGAFDAAPMESRVRYTAAVARAAEARGWSWAYWQFDADFIAWDMKTDSWVKPILGALAPDSPGLK